MKVSLQVTDVDVQEFFKEVVDLDDQYARSINSFMCTDFCICPGIPTDSWVKEYNALDDDRYTKYNRMKTGYTGEINLQAFSDPDKKRPLFWTYDPASQVADPDLVSLSSQSFLDCADNMDNIVEKYEQSLQSNQSLTASQKST